MFCSKETDIKFKNSNQNSNLSKQGGYKLDLKVIGFIGYLTYKLPCSVIRTQNMNKRDNFSCNKLIHYSLRNVKKTIYNSKNSTFCKLTPLLLFIICKKLYAQDNIDIWIYRTKGYQGEIFIPLPSLKSLLYLLVKLFWLI